MKKIKRSSTIACYGIAIGAISTMLMISASIRNVVQDPVLSPEIPKDASIPSDFPASALPIDFFDDYSWRTFIALVWPALENRRGVANVNKTINGGGPLVFETYKSDWEIFHPDGTAPATNWHGYDDAPPCQVEQGPAFGDLILAFTSKFGNLAQAGFGTLEGPLVAQNMTYVRFLTGFNQTEFDKIQADQLHLRSNLNNVVFPPGAIDVKSAWIDMQSIPHPERYYTRQAWVFDLEANTCVKRLVGLVGLHIVQKTPDRPQWIWSSFEHIDNIPQPEAQSPFTFHDSGPTPMPTDNPIAFPPPIIPPSKFNVSRIKKIHGNTVAMNKKYRQLLKDNNSVWQFYQLVMTQWPTAIKQPNLSGMPANTFPGTGATTSFSNVTMETFDQSSVSTGCMACHNLARRNADFLFSLEVNAFPSILTQATNHPAMFVSDTTLPITNAVKDPVMKGLKNLIESSRKQRK